MNAPIAYRDCKTQKDYAIYRQHKTDLSEARSAAIDLQKAIIASGQLNLLNQVQSLVDAIDAALTAYTADEATDSQDFFHDPV